MNRRPDCEALHRVSRVTPRMILRDMLVNAGLNLTFA